MRLLQKILPKSIEPVQFVILAIEWVIAICTLIGGLYLFTPLYDYSQAINGPTAFGVALAHPWSIGLWGALLLVGAIFVMWGLARDKPQFKSIGFFAIFLARFFQILTTWLAAGFLPISWIYPFTVMLIVFLLWALARTEVNRRVT